MTQEELALAAVLKNLSEALPEPGYGMPESQYKAALQRDQEERAQQATSDVAAGEELARRMGVPPVTAGVKPEKAIEYQRQAKQGPKSKPVTKPTAEDKMVGAGESPGVVAVRTPEGRVIFTNRPSAVISETGGQGLDQQSAQADLLGRETGPQANGPFAIRPGQGTLSQSAVPSPESYTGLDDTKYEMARAQQSPLVQELMDEARNLVRQGSMESLQLEAARKKLDPKFQAEMELSRRQALIQEGLKDPGVQLRVIQNLNAWKAKNPGATPEQAKQIEAALLAEAAQRYAISQDPEIQLAQAKGFGLMGS